MPDDGFLVFRYELLNTHECCYTHVIHSLYYSTDGRVRNPKNQFLQINPLPLWDIHSCMMSK